jgi:hypothetical protein
MEGPRRHYWKMKSHPFPFASLGLDTKYPRGAELIPIAEASMIIACASLLCQDFAGYFFVHCTTIMVKYCSCVGIQVLVLSLTQASDGGPRTTARPRVISNQVVKPRHEL